MDKPGMIITGAAGFLGRQLVGAFQPDYQIFAIDRRPPEAGEAPQGPGIQWFQVNISDGSALQAAMAAIRQRQPVEIVLHLAGYYDFSGDEHVEYRRSNVDGMRNVLEQCSQLGLKRLIFTSSIAACPFPPPGEVVDEQTSPTGVEPYSRSKRAGEEMLHDYHERLPANIVRLAAVFTDWCEYEPLTNFLHTWCSNHWDSRILGGRGNWAIPFIHMQDLVAFFRAVVASVDRLEPLEVLQGSPNGSTTQRELYDTATGAFFDSPRHAVPMPKPLAQFGIRLREGLGRLNGHMPFERSWMGTYIDQRLDVDASRTHRRLGWQPKPELAILRRVPIMVQHLSEQPEEWHRRHQRRKSSQLV